MLAIARANNRRRMTGHRYTIVEGCHAQRCQEWLFRIGRADSVRLPVTWTLTSNHVGCGAIDLKSRRGGVADRDWLKRWTKRVGISTLDETDVGHVFLPQQKGFATMHAKR